MKPISTQKSNTKKHTDVTSSETTSIGFVYQDYFFLWKLLSLKKGQSVGLEVKDDVHTELDNDVQILYQLKHTVQTNAKGDPINLTAADYDLWKTLYNWVKIITDKNDNRDKFAHQISFLKKTFFVLASNKSSNDKNVFLTKISALQKNEIDISELRKKFEDFSTTDAKIEKYRKVILSVEDEVLELFFKRTYFDLGETDILKKCRDEIFAKMIPENEVDEVFKKVDSSIREDNFINIKNGEKIEVTFEDFYKKYRIYFNIARDNRLHSKDFPITLPNKLEEQVFIKQLLEIEDFRIDEMEIMVEYTRFKMKLINNIESWFQNGYITREEIKAYREDAINQWKNGFRAAYRRQISDEKINEKGLELLDSTRKLKLQISAQELETDLSNGEFYYLSDIPEIGWKQGWEKHKK